MRISKILVASLFISTSALAAKTECIYQLDPASVKVNWTAFKTTEKVAVQGTVVDVKVESPQKSKSLKALLQKTIGSGSFDSVKKSDSGNPARDQTVYDKFFSLLANHAQFKGTFSSVKGDDAAGTVTLMLSVNQKKEGVPMTYKLADDGAFEATGSFDMLSLGMQKAHESIHTACEVLHKGKDGVSKTWTELALKISGMIKKECAQK